MVNFDEEKIELFIQGRPTFVVLGIFLLSLAFRLLWLNSESAWIDEAYSIHLSTHTLQDIFLGTINDQHPPLYYVFLKFWLGNSLNVTKARFLSALIGSLNIVQVFFILRELKLTNWKTQLISCLLISISPMHIMYSQEARMYILLLFFVLASLQILIQLINNLENDSSHRKKFLWLFLIICNIFSLYTHYFSIFIILFEFLYFIFYIIAKKLKPKKILIGVFSFFTIVLAFTPWIPVVINQIIFHKLNWIGAPTLFIFLTSINRLIIGPGSTYLPGEVNLVFTLVILIFSIYSFFKIIQKNKEELFPLFFLILWILIPISSVSLISIKYPIFQFKQLIIILVPVLITTVILITRTFKKFGMLIICCLVGINYLSSIYQQLTLTKDNWRGLTNYIEQNYKIGDVIIFNNSASQLGYTLYQKKDIPIEGFPPGYDIVTGGWSGHKFILEDDIDILEEAKQKFPRVWYVQYYPDLWDSERLVISWLNTHMRTRSEQTYGSILLKLYD